MPTSLRPRIFARFSYLVYFFVLSSLTHSLFLFPSLCLCLYLYSFSFLFPLPFARASYWKDLKMTHDNKSAKTIYYFFSLPLLRFSSSQTTFYRSSSFLASSILFRQLCEKNTCLSGIFRCKGKRKTIFNARKTSLHHFTVNVRYHRITLREVSETKRKGLENLITRNIAQKLDDRV